MITLWHSYMPNFPKVQLKAFHFPSPCLWERIQKKKSKYPFRISLFTAGSCLFLVYLSLSWKITPFHHSRNPIKHRPNYAVLITTARKTTSLPSSTYQPCRDTRQQQRDSSFSTTYINIQLQDHQCMVGGKKKNQCRRERDLQQAVINVTLD